MNRIEFKHVYINGADGKTYRLVPAHIRVANRFGIRMDWSELNTYSHGYFGRPIRHPIFMAVNSRVARRFRRRISNNVFRQAGCLGPTIDGRVRQ